MGLKTNVYIDGFNLYYGLLKDKPKRKWLDLLKLAQLLRKHDAINHIHYFTARVAALPSDPQEPQRQEIYLRALRTIPNLTIHEGQFLVQTVWRPLAKSPPGEQQFVQVLQYGEKGSDVNLATMLLCDAADRKFEQAMVVTNDSDLALPIELVRTKFRLKVGVYSPRPHVTAMLRLAATFCGALRAGPIEASQFADTLHDGDGYFSKPPHW